MIQFDPQNGAATLTCITEYGDIDISSSDFSMGERPFFVENTSANPVTISAVLYGGISETSIAIQEGRAPFFCTKVAHNSSISLGTLKYFR